MPRSDKEGLLSRWSRLKRESAASGAGDQKMSTRERAETLPDANANADKSAGATGAAESMPVLPSIDELSPDSDFQAFMDPRGDDGLRRAALKTLFRSPAFNVPDGLDEYAADYTALEKLTPAMVAGLKHAQRTLFSKKENRGETQLAGTEPMQRIDPDQSRKDPGDEDKSIAWADATNPAAGSTMPTPQEPDEVDGTAAKLTAPGLDEPVGDASAQPRARSTRLPPAPDKN